MKSESVRIAATDGLSVLSGELSLPDQPGALVIFAHGSGSGRENPSDRYVATVLQEARLATLRFALLDEVEARTHHNRFDEELVAARLEQAAHWAARQPGLGHLPRGYFGVDTGAAGALIAAARGNEQVGAIVSRGGRPDLAWSWLHLVRAPTLLIVGESDATARESNQRALEQLQCDKHFVLVPGATHLFSGPAALRAAAEEARQWFLRCLLPPADTAARNDPTRTAPRRRLHRK